jgi:hypothetical protein
MRGGREEGGYEPRETFRTRIPTDRMTQDHLRLSDSSTHSLLYSSALPRPRHSAFRWLRWFTAVTLRACPSLQICLLLSIFFFGKFLSLHDLAPGGEKGDKGTAGTWDSLSAKRNCSAVDTFSCSAQWARWWAVNWLNKAPIIPSGDGR